MKEKFKNINIYIIILVVVNSATLGYIWFSNKSEIDNRKNPEHHPPRIVKYLAETLDFSEAQKTAIEKLRELHFDQTDHLQREQHDLKRMIMNESFREDPDSLIIDSLSKNIGELQFRLEKIVSNHFMRISEICNPVQRKKLFRLFDEINRSER